MNLAKTLSRTVLLVKLDVFPDLDEATILDGLTRIRVRLAADATTANSRAGQTAIIAALVAVAQSGARVQLDIPDARLLGAQPPLRGSHLVSSLMKLGRDLVVAPGAPDAEADLAVVFGNAPAGRATEILHVSGDQWACRLSAQDTDAAGVHGELPFGALLAASAIGAESLRCALRHLEARTGHAAGREHSLATPDEIALELQPLPVGPRDIGQLDIISAGAITNAALFALLRWPALQGRLRILDRDHAAESNLNRYALTRRSQLGRLKVRILAEHATPGVIVEALPMHLTSESAGQLLPLARRVLVGVDDIPARWLVSQHAPDWVCVAASTHFTVMVSEHIAGGPCAGCLHPRDDDVAGEIPTTSFVSHLAGYLQAYRLLAHSAGIVAAPPTLAAPFNLGAARALMPIGLAPRADCPVGCAASRAAPRRQSFRGAVASSQCAVSSDGHGAAPPAIAIGLPPSGG